MTEARKHLSQLLRDAAKSDIERKLTFYSQGSLSMPNIITYSDLYKQARRYAGVLKGLHGFQHRKPVLLYLDDHCDAITWFWAVTLANALPVPAPAFPNAVEDRHKYLCHLASLLGSPLCITKETLMEQFDGNHGIQLHTVESLRRTSVNPTPATNGERGSTHEGPGPASSDTAVLMLTSGSTGNSKAVRLTHRQMLASVVGKALVRPLPSNKPLLNWIGLDHVANLLETHLLALHLNLDQVHVHATDVVSTPEIFFDLLSRHRVSRTFAPNFFLAKLVSAIQDSTNSWDLSSLEILISGGEANDVDTIVALNTIAERNGAGPNVVMPAFGMTETCAGSIYNTECPQSDMLAGRSVASLGHCMPGIEMRVVEHKDDGIHVVPLGEMGDLEVRGDVVFEGYYRGDEATRDAFTPDGWFRTGDRANVDQQGNLNLVGRVKEVFNINGVKYSCAHVQASLEQAVGARVDRLISFPSRAPKAATEQVTVAFIPLDHASDPEHLIAISNDIMRCCVLLTGSRPCVFSLRDPSSLPISALGKISKAKMRALFESGAFSAALDAHHTTTTTTLKAQSAQNGDGPQTPTETQLLADLHAVFGAPAALLGVDSCFFDFGFTSMDLIRLKRLVDRRRRRAPRTPLVTFLKHATVRSLAAALDAPSGSDASNYDPVVTLRAAGRKPPLWLLHPGVGEVLVFVPLAAHLAGDDDDRPVHALRARGFEAGERPWRGVDEAVAAYAAAIRARQPRGPYALVGYSYGAMLAFEVAKRLEGGGGGDVSGDGDAEEANQVRFLGCLNLPPHIAFRMRRLDRGLCLLHLALFLGLAGEAYAELAEGRLFGVPYDDAVAEIREVVDRRRLRELGLDEAGLLRWADLAFGLQSMAVDYEPKGLVDSIDVFHAVPLKAVAKSRDDWLENHLGKWKDFSRSEPRFHRVGGAHYTMLGPEHVAQFALTLKAALRDRGI
ncbi:acyl-protein synthetase [Xylariomycetidae sp. FL0641]|nr:acyl-protein synthetase [Xylariomycetidae sp. FL0641]